MSERKPFAMDRACYHCGFQGDGFIETKNNQDVVYCGKEDPPHWAGYNAPKTATGREVRSVSTRAGFKPKQRARILERDNYRCGLCGAKGNLHVDHLISVDTGKILELSEREIWDDENLITLCDECNLGKGKQTISARQWVCLALVLKARIIERNNLTVS